MLFSSYYPVLSSTESCMVFYGNDDVLCPKKKNILFDVLWHCHSSVLYSVGHLILRPIVSSVILTMLLAMSSSVFYGAASLLAVLCCNTWFSVPWHHQRPWAWRVTALWWRRCAASANSATNRTISCCSTWLLPTCWSACPGTPSPPCPPSTTASSSGPLCVACRVSWPSCWPWWPWRHWCSSVCTVTSPSAGLG